MVTVVQTCAFPITSRPATPRTLRGRGPSGCCSASPSDGAGSVDTIRVRWPARTASSPRAAAHVVLPTPPLPPTNLNVGVSDRRGSLVLVAFERGIDARDLVLGGREGRRSGALAARANLAQPRQDVRLEGVEFRLAHFSEVQPHLRGEQFLAQVRVVVELGVDSGGDLVENEAEAADQDRVEDEHVEAMAV